jgi:hypothetical protein
MLVTAQKKGINTCSSWCMMSKDRASKDRVFVRPSGPPSSVVVVVVVVVVMVGRNLMMVIMMAMV